MRGHTAAVLAVVFLMRHIMMPYGECARGLRGMRQYIDNNDFGVDDIIAPTHIKPAVIVDLKEQVLGTKTSTRSAYYGTLQVGSPAVDYTFVFDTGSGHLILPSGYCSSKVCKMHKRYRRSASRTGVDIDGDGTPVATGAPRDQLQVQFGTGDVTGVFVEDVVCMDKQAIEDLRTSNTSARSSAGAAQALQTDVESDVPDGCFKMRFLAATKMSEQPFSRFKFDGVLGLGLSGLSQSPEFNFMHVLAGSVEKWGSKMPSTFGVFLKEKWEEKSQLALGGWDSENVDGDVFWNPVEKPELGHWIIKVKSLRVNGEVLDICNEGCKAVVDTGTSLMSVPTDAFAELYNLMRHDAGLDGLCKGPGPQLHFELEHFTVTMGPEDYADPRFYNNKDDGPVFGKAPFVSKENGTTTRHDVFCHPMLMSMDLEAPIGPKLFILGEPVLRKYYTVYDANVKRVGFGRAKHQPKPEAEDSAEDFDDSWFDEVNEEDREEQEALERQEQETKGGPLKEEKRE